MNVLKIDQVSAAAQAGALDASLSYLERYQENRQLIAQTAIGGLIGVQQSLTETGLLGAAISALEETNARTAAANVEATKNPFVAGTAAQRATLINAVSNGGKAKSNALNTPINAAKAAAVAATNGTATGTAERAAGQAVVAAANQLSTANTAFRAGDSSQIQGAYDAANAAKTQAQNAYNAADASHKAAALAVLNAANQTLTVAQSLLDLRDSSSGKLAGSTPTVTDLSGGYTLSTWGNTGYVTIADASGAGVIISPDGSVDPIDGSGKGWKFNNTSTFVLPGETKVTINPGNPANILVSRGVQAFTVDNVSKGSSPVMSDYTSLNGRDVDQASNDGYILSIGSNASRWTLGGSVLGDESSREVVATSPLTNELKLDPTDVAISDGLQSFIKNHLDSKGLDYDGDGKLNNVELANVAGQISRVLDDLQLAFEQALLKLTTANNALEDLNVMLELLRKEKDRSDSGKTPGEATTKSELQALERKLVEALFALRGSAPAAPVEGGIAGSAEKVLGQLTSITQQGGVQPTTTAKPQQSSQTAANQPGANTPDVLGDSLRRASRLLSGISGGLNLNFLELPTSNRPATEATETTAAEAAGATAKAEQPAKPAGELPSLEELASALTTLAGQLKPIDGTGEGVAADLSQVKLAAGLAVLLGEFARLGVVDTAALKDAVGLQALLQQVSDQLAPSGEGAAGNVGVGNGAPAEASLLSFLGILAQLGSVQAAVNPQLAQTNPGQLERASMGSLTDLTTSGEQVLDVLSGQAELGSAGVEQGSGGRHHATGALTQQSRTAEQVDLVLKGLASLGSAGAQQSTNNLAADAPTSAELRLGLQSFLLALSAFGIFATNAQQDQTAIKPGGLAPATGVEPTGGIGIGEPTFETTNPNTAAIKTITGNFQTDPALQKIFEENLSKAIQVQQKQLSRANTLFEQSQKVVQRFVTLVKEDDLVRDIVKSDDLSDEQQAMFDDRMKELRKDWGIDWGGPVDDGSPASKANLTARAIQSGMMV